MFFCRLPCVDIFCMCERFRILIVGLKLYVFKIVFHIFILHSKNFRLLTGNYECIPLPTLFHQTDINQTYQFWPIRREIMFLVLVQLSIFSRIYRSFIFSILKCLLCPLLCLSFLFCIVAIFMR